METSFQTLVSKCLCPSLEGWLLQLPQAQEDNSEVSVFKTSWVISRTLVAELLAYPRDFGKTISKRPISKSLQLRSKFMDSSSKRHGKPQFQETPMTLEHQVQIQGTQNEERKQRKFHTRPQDHKPVQVKCTRKPFPESCNCLTTVSKNIHKFPSSIQTTWTTVPNNNNKTKTNYDPQLLGYLI